MPRMHLYEVIEGNMMKKVYMICVIALLVGLSATTAFASSGGEECDSNLKIAGMEQRILVDKLATQRESFEDKARRLETKVIQLERDLENVTNGSDKRIDDLRSHLNERVSDIKSTLGWALGIISLIIALLSLLGWKTIVSTTKKKAEEVTKEKVRDVVTKDLIRNIIEEKGGPLIKQIIDEIKENAHQKVEELREEMKKLVETGMTKPKSKEEKQNMEAYVKWLSLTEKEEQYTYNDWFLKGIAQYENKEYDHSATSFVKASSIERTGMILGSAALAYTKAEKNNLAEEYYKKAINTEPRNAINLNNYALLLYEIRKEYDDAEKYYKQAIKADPNYATALGNYANLLKNIREDYEQAEEFYKRAIKAEPAHANHLGNYAGFLLARGKSKDGFEKLEEARSLAAPIKEKELILELWFYRYAHKDNAADRSNALKEIKKLIGEGVRSPDFDMRANVKRAIKDGHPNPDLLKDLERIICAKKDARELERYEA